MQLFGTANIGPSTGLNRNENSCCIELHASLHAWSSTSGSEHRVCKRAGIIKFIDTLQLQRSDSISSYILKENIYSGIIIIYQVN